MPEEIKNLAKRSSRLILKVRSLILLLLLGLLTSLTGCWWNIMYGPPVVMYGPNPGDIQPLYGVAVSKFVAPDQTPRQEQ